MFDRFEEIRTFVAVVEAKGFKRAADRMGLVKSAVSRRIRDLEDRLGTRLFNRTTRGISLTGAGEAFYERGRKLLADLSEAEDQVSAGAQAAVGRLRVSAPVSFTVHCVAPVMHDFISRHPRLQVHIEENDRLVDIVSEGYDMAIRISRLKDSTLIQRRISTIRHVCCASPAYLDKHGRPRTPDDVRAHQGVAYGHVEPSRYWMFRDDVSVEARSTLVMNNGDALCAAAIAGCGLVIVPTFIAHRAIERGELEVVLDDHAREPVALYAVYPSSSHPPAKLRLFVDFLVARFGREPFWDEAIGGRKRKRARS